MDPPSLRFGGTGAATLGWMIHIVRDVVQDARELAHEPNDPGFAHHVSTVLLAQLAVHACEAPKEPTDPAERFDQLRDLLHTVSEVRRDDHRSRRIALELEHHARQG